MQQELGSLPLKSSQWLKLQNAGYITVGDIFEEKPASLGAELKISEQEAEEILKLVRGETDNNGDSGSKKTSSCRTALEMLCDERSQSAIITFSQQLDESLGGGIPMSKITEFCGSPGTGKTQICLQLAVDVQIPECFGGAEGEAIYIDTDGTFIVDRVRDIAQAAVSHCKMIADAEQLPEQQEKIKQFTLESILTGILYFRCSDHSELTSLVQDLPRLVNQHPRVLLVVVDSLAFPFRCDFQDMALRTRVLGRLAQNLIRLAVQQKLAVVLTNQMTTKVSLERGRQPRLVPALGQSWAHCSNIRIILSHNNNIRQALLYKSPSRPDVSVPFQITTGGFRDACPTNDVTDDVNHDDENPRKRIKLS